METVIKSRIPGLQSLINKTIAELEAELGRLGKPIASDAGVSIYFLSLMYTTTKFFGEVRVTSFQALVYVPMFIHPRCLL